uniref:Uncharacterized protein n=1 Tax=viral metagenome TaxID=1070528 RepID=A0A6C0KSS9_9ZZZZ
MDSYLLPGGLIAVGIMLIVLGAYKLNEMDYSAQNTQNSCSTLLQKQVMSGIKNGDDCALWDGAQCRKGKYNNGQCVAPASVAVLAAGGLGLILLIIGIVLAFRHHKAEAKKEEGAFFFF